ncbi:hypothetical protein F4677DRAFT_439832 [Hypoxylon crocopeplum]|nr:hypothetical protein F4677DRAFT_439832 [Hypoxylon crocopeplum]
MDERCQCLLLARNERLLLTGEMADIHVFCGPRVWNLHRAILCPVSTWFQKAVGNRWLSTYPRYIVLDNKSPVMMYNLFYYLYTDKTHPLLKESLGNPKTIFEACGNVLETSKYFGAKDFQSLLAGPLDRVFERQVSLLERLRDAMGEDTWNSPDFDAILPDATFVAEFFRFAKLVYSDDFFKPTRKVVQSFFKKAGFQAFRNKRFQHKISKVPGLASDLLRVLVVEVMDMD